MFGEREKNLIKKQMISKVIDQGYGATEHKDRESVCMFCKLAQALDLRTPVNNYHYFLSFKKEKLYFIKPLERAMKRFYMEYAEEPREDMMLDSEDPHYEAFYKKHLLGPENQGNWDKIFSYMEE